MEELPFHLVHALSDMLKSGKSRYINCGAREDDGTPFYTARDTVQEFGS